MWYIFFLNLDRNDEANNKKKHAKSITSSVFYRPLNISSAVPIQFQVKSDETKLIEFVKYKYLYIIIALLINTTK